MRRRLVVAAAVAALCAWQLWLLYGFRDHLDLHPCDGVVYLKNGLAMGEGRLLPQWLAWGPVQAAGYALLHAVGVLPTAAQDVMTVLVAIGSTLALFALLAVLAGARVAWPLAALWAASECVLHDRFHMSPPPTYLLSIALAWAGLAAALRGRLLLGAAALLLAGLERAEMSLAIVVGGLMFSWFARGVARRRAWWLVVAAAALLVAQQGNAAVQERSWLAFRQHYAGAGVAADGLDADFARPDALIQRDFAGARSPLSAALTSPGAVLRHVGGNVLRLPAGIAGVMPFASAPWWRWGSTLLVVAVLMVAIAARRRRFVRLLRLRRAALAATFTAAVVAVAIALVLMPRADLLLSVSAPMVAVVALALRALLPRSRPVAGWAILAVVAIAMAPRPFAEHGGVPRETRALVRLLQRNPFASGERLAMRFAEQLVVFAPPEARVRPVDLVQLRARCNDVADAAAALAEAAPDAVLVSPAALAALGPLGTALAAELSTDRWTIDDYFLPVLLYRRLP